MTQVLDDQGRPLDRISVVGLRARGRHGVLAHETELGQEFGVDVVLHLDTRAAAAGDDLTATVDYGGLCARLRDVVEGEPAQLVETLAQRLADVALEPDRVVAVDVTVHKPYAPVPVPVTDVTVTVHRRREGR